MMGVVSCSIIYQILLKSINWCKSQDGEVRLHVCTHICTHSLTLTESSW